MFPNPRCHDGYCADDRAREALKAWLGLGVQLGYLRLDTRGYALKGLAKNFSELFGLKVLRTPVQAPKANAYCERLMGTIRRECLDYVIPFSEKHLRTILRDWVAHYNQGRPHSSLGPGIPDLCGKPIARPTVQRHELPAACRIRIKDVLSGLHHEYWLEETAA